MPADPLAVKCQRSSDTLHLLCGGNAVKANQQHAVRGSAEAEHELSEVAILRQQQRSLFVRDSQHFFIRHARRKLGDSDDAMSRKTQPFNDRLIHAFVGDQDQAVAGSGSNTVSPRRLRAA